MPALIDLRYTTALANTSACNEEPLLGELGIPDARIIAPGDANRSLIVNRASRRDVHGMPPLGSTVIDADGIALLTNWINSLGACP